jgi:hypothetical protein
MIEMTEVKNLTEYMNVESKPKRNNIPWTPEETKELLKNASTFFKNDGDPQIECLAIKYQRSTGAITVKLSKEGWFKDNGLGWNNKAKEGTLKTQILDYVKDNPWCFSKDVNKALNVKSTSTLSTLYKEGLIQRVRHRGNGPYLYSYNDVTVEELAEEVITELGSNEKVEPIEVKPMGKVGGTRQIIKPTSETFMSKIKQLFGRT